MPSRSSRQAISSSTLDQKTVEVSGSRVHLTGKEYQMLELLSLRKGTTLDQGNVPEPSLWRHGRARTEDHRTSSSASCAKSWPMPARVATTSRRCGAAATCCANRARTTSASPPDACSTQPYRTKVPRGAFFRFAPVFSTVAAGIQAFVRPRDVSKAGTTAPFERLTSSLFREDEVALPDRSGARSS